jgi:CDP-diacylglycerol--glycerol-3-phosphate 3-phosphatidyltransferase
MASWAAPVAARLSLDPDTLTAAGLVTAAIAAVLFAAGEFPLAALAVAISGAADILDGAAARARSGGSPRGAFLDSAADRISDNLIYGGIVFYFATDPANSPAAVIATFVAASASNVASYLKSRAEAVGIPCNVGLFKRQERFIVLILGGIFGPERFVGVLIVLAAFAVESMVTRFIYCYQRMTVAADQTQDGTHHLD